MEIDISSAFTKKSTIQITVSRNIMTCIYEIMVTHKSFGPREKLGEFTVSDYEAATRPIGLVIRRKLMDMTGLSADEARHIVIDAVPF